MKQDLFEAQATPATQAKPARVCTEPRSGVYKTTYGNACEYRRGACNAYDMDSASTIPLEMIAFDEYIRPLD